MTFKQEIIKIVEKNSLEKSTNPITISDQVAEEVIRTINDLAAHSGKGFCIRTANRIRNKINETGQEVSPEPEERVLKRRTFR